MTAAQVLILAVVGAALATWLTAALRRRRRARIAARAYLVARIWEVL